MSHSVRRLPPSLQKLPSASSPISFERLLWNKFPTPKVPTQVHEHQIISAGIDGVSDDTTTSRSKEDPPESDSESTSLCTFQSNDSIFATISQSAHPTLFTSLPPTLRAPDPASNPKDVISINSQKEASIRLAAAGVRKKVIQAEHHLASYLAEEHVILGQLYRELADQVGKEVEVANLELSHIRHSVQEQGFEFAPPGAISDSAQFPVSPTKKQRLPHL